MKYRLQEEDKRKKFLSLKNPADLAHLLKLQKEDLVALITNPEYRNFEIPKRSGGIRKVTVPCENLMKVQRKINIMLQAIYSTKFPEPVHGFVSVYKDDKIFGAMGRGIVTNAAPHVGKDFVLNLDLKDFFSSISATTVRKIFTGFPFYFDWELATCIALVCTYEKKLPTGSPTSPVLSNFACREMDKLLLQLSTENKLIFTRYADDITFSSNVAFNDELIKNILIQIKKSGFTVNEKKFRIQNKFNKQVVTGIKVNSKINVERSFVRNLRAVFHDIDVNGLALASKKYFKSVSGKSEADLISSLNGKIQYLGQVRGKDDPIYLRYLAKINVLEILSK